MSNAVIFQSKHAGYMVHLKDPVFYTHPDTGFREQVRPSLVADFLDPSSSGVMTAGPNAEGGTTNYPNVRGGTFDTDEAADRLQWSPEEKAYAEQKLLSIANNPRDPAMWLWEPPVPEKPWPTFDETPATKIAATAEVTGQVAEALAYLKYVDKHPGAQQQLQDKLNEQQELEAAEEALTA